MLPTDIEVWYRYEDKTYASVDEWDNVHTHTELQLHEFEVANHTPKGVWIFTFGRFDINGLRASDARREKRYILGTANKMFALPTKQLALESFVARKEKQANIHEAIANKARRMIRLAKLQMDKVHGLG